MGLACDREKGELRIHGKRYAVTDVKEFCRRLDLLVGPVIGAVQMRSLEGLIGQQDLETIKKETPNATLKEIVNSLVEMDAASGLGVTSLSAADNYCDPILIETSNPLVAAKGGAASAFQPSWWCGAMSSLLDRPLEVVNIVFDNEKNVLKFQLITRKGHHEK